MLRFEETGSGVIVRPDGAPAACLRPDEQPRGRRGRPRPSSAIHLHDGRVLQPDARLDRPQGRRRRPPARRDDLPAARLGDSDEAAVGTWVLALGSPFGLTHSVSQGIISARSRHEDELQDDGVENQDFLQTDAAINPGNSGGPLVNLKGEVIGINTAIASNGGGSEGVGFSIPINLARWIMDQLSPRGGSAAGAMGVGLADLERRPRPRRLGLDRPRGAGSSSVQPATRPPPRPASAGGDVVLRFNGVDVANLNHLINLVAMAPIGPAADVVVWRDGHELIKAVTVADLERIAAIDPRARSREGRPLGPGRAGQAPAARRPGADRPRRHERPEARPAGQDLGRRGPDIDPSSPLAAQLQPMDVIDAAGKAAVRSVDDLNKALATRPAGRGPLELWVQRPDASAAGCTCSAVRVP